MMNKILTYSELSSIDNFFDRFEYLKLGGLVGEDTFGSRRYLNQQLYHTAEWRSIRNRCLIRDDGWEMGLRNGYEYMSDLVIVHHMNPITINDIVNKNPIVFDPEYLICVSDKMHRAIHYGDINQLVLSYTERQPGDTKLW